ncbi:lanthionine synthetase C family protein [Kitasatospora sp. NPDC089797]|uniref:lanthionine synthetase C family protein n=1 Tax=Kitasatospora sp. NPDC089797 TaxID=3155298 RepID=UPI00342DAA0A
MRNAETAVAAVAERLRDPERVRAIAARPGNEDARTGASPWSAASLGEGHPGVALLYAELARRDRSWRPVTHAHLSSAVAALGAGGPTDSLFSGAPALALAVRRAVAGPGDYAGLLAALDRRVAARTGALLRLERERLDAARTGPAMAGYDVVGGLTGLGRYLLACGEGQRPLLVALLEHLVALSRPLRIDGSELPGWWVPGPPSPAVAARYPGGHLNLGLAHGIPGPLALLSLARLAGVDVPGAAGAAHRIAGWLLGQRLRDAAGVPQSDWPAVVGPEAAVGRGRAVGPEPVIGADGEAAVSGGAPARIAWCYGSPGIARALQLAGRAFGVPEWEAEAVRALHAALDRPRERWGLDDAMLCHGTAGLLQVAGRVARDSGDARLAARLPGLVGEVLASYDGAVAFGFPTPPVGGRGGGTRAREQDPARERGPDRAGFLEGAAGVALALLAQCGSTDDGEGHGDGELPWDAALLLA